MKLNLKVGQPVEQWETVDHGDESFEVLVRNPSFDQKMIDRGMMAYGGTESAGQLATHRLTSAIVGWRGLLHGDSTDVEIEFSEQNMHAICSQYPQIADQLFLFAHKAFEGTLTDETAKNSE